jgi:hypothetical protein
MTRPNNSTVRAEAVDKFGTPIPPEIQGLAARFVGQRVLARGDHPHAGKSGTVDRVEFVSVLGKWGFVVNFDDGLDGFVFSGEEWTVLQ